MGSRLHGNYDGRRQAHPQTTGDGGRTHNRHSRDGGNPRRGPAMGSRLHGNYGRRQRRTHKRRAAAGDPTIVIPATAGIHRGGRRWGPVSTGTTGGGGAPTIVIPATAGIHRGGPAMGSRLHAGTTGAAAHPQTTGGGGRSHNRHSRDGGNPQRGGRRWGSRLHGTVGGGGAPTNDGRRRAIPQSSFPRRRESTWGPVGDYGRRRRTHKRQWAAGDPTIVIPATAGIHGFVIPATAGKSTAGGRRWVPVSTGTTGGGGRRTHKRRETAARSHNRHSRDGGNPQRGAGDGFPSPRGNDGRRRRTHKRREAAGDPTIVIPATAGIHRGGPAMGSRLHGNDGRRRRTHKRRAAAIPVGGGRSHNRHSRDGGNPRRGAGDGVPSPRGTTGGSGAPTNDGRRRPTNDGRRRAIPQSSFPRRRESTEGGRRWGPVSTGNDGRRRRTHKRRAAAIPQTTGGGGRSHNRHSRDGGNPQRGAGDGVPSPRERRWAAAGAPTNYGRRRRTHNRQVSGEAFVPSTLNSYDDYASLTVILAVDTITRSNCRFGSRASDSHVTSPF